MLAINDRVDGGRFQIIDVLGKGGSGVAYLALDTHSSPKHPKYYAIKCVPRPASDADASALLREIRLHKLVAQHPAIVTLKRCIQEGPYQLFIMDFLPGGDLFRQITQQHRYFHNDALIADVFLQIIDAVEYCHENGVFHRDLKPENILCNQDGTRVVLADFGLATRQAVSDDLGVGSGYYMSPECNAGPAYSTVANDLWSLGVILCNLAFGRNPWAQAVATDATFAAYAANPSYLSAILPTSPAVARILTGPHGLFSLDPRRRMGLVELRDEVRNVRRFTMNEDEMRFASPEARSVAGVLKNAVREREARLRATVEQERLAQLQQHSSEVLVVPGHAPVPVVRPQEIILESRSPAPVPAQVAIPQRPPMEQHHRAPHHRNSSLRLVLAKVAAPFSRNSSQQAEHLRRPSAAPSDVSASSSSSVESLDSPGPLTPPASAYTSAVDVSYELQGHHAHHHHHSHSPHHHHHHHHSHSHHHEQAEYIWPQTQHQLPALVDNKTVYRSTGVPDWAPTVVSTVPVSVPRR